MLRDLLSIAALVSCATVAAAQPASTDLPSDVQTALARPLSPGAVALLLPHTATPAVARRVIEALEDQRPEVRAIAARVAFTTRLAVAGPALGAALDKETNAAAAADIVRALALIQGAAADDRITRRLSEFDSRATMAWLSVVSRARPADVWAHLSAVRSGGDGVGSALAALVEAQPKAAEAAFAELATSPHLAPAYLAYLGTLRSAELLPPWPILASGLAAGAPRAVVLQLLIAREAAGGALPPEAREALRALDQGPDSAWLVLYQELVRRGAKPAPPKQPQLDTILRLDPTALSDSFLAHPMLARLDADEIAALRQIVGPNWAPTSIPVPSVPRSSTPKVVPREEPDGSSTRLARPLSTTLLQDLQSLLACQAKDGNVAVVDVTYRPTGQIRSVVNVRPVDPDGCNQVAALTAALDVAPGALPLRDGRVDRLVIGLRPTDLSCDRSTTMPEGPPVKVGARLTAPKKTRNVPPVYPQHLIKDRVQGVVLAESLITTSGCVVDAVVTRRTNSELDVSALTAIGEWRYEPGRVNGFAVPVVMTVTVNFALH